MPAAINGDETSQTSGSIAKVALGATDDAAECFVGVPRHLRELVEAGDGFHVTDHSGAHLFVRKGAAQRRMFSATWSGLVVAGSATVTTGLDMIHFKKKADQV